MVGHDRGLPNHVQTYWSMPESVADHLSNEAKVRLVSNDETQIARFVRGIDALPVLSQPIVRKVSALLESDLAASETIQTRATQAREFVDGFVQKQAERVLSKNGNTGFDYIVKDLVDMGIMNLPTKGSTVVWPKTKLTGKIIQDSPKRKLAQRVVTDLVAAYMHNAITLMSRSLETRATYTTPELQRQLANALLETVDPQPAEDYLAEVHRKRQSLRQRRASNAIGPLVTGTYNKAA